jgi:hypothetical protein
VALAALLLVAECLRRLVSRDKFDAASWRCVARLNVSAFELASVFYYTANVKLALAGARLARWQGLRLLRLVVYDRRVTEQSPYPIVVLTIIYWVLGLLVGAAAGAITSLCLTRDVKVGPIFKDGLAGAVGFLAAMLGVSMIPVEPHVVMMVSNGSVTTTTTFRYQHPFPIALGAAVVLGALREMYAFWRARRRRVTGSEASAAVPK